MTRLSVAASLIVALALAAPATAGPISYTLRDAHFFGGVPGPTREIVEAGTLGPGASESLPYTFSTGGPTPVVFTALATNRRSPFELTVSQRIEAASSTALQFNIAPHDPTSIVSIVQSRVQEDGLLVTGGSGQAYLLPTFGVDGAFDDAHATAASTLSICAGIPSCPLTGLGFSQGGVQPIDVLYTPTVGLSTRFTFDQPFNLFFFINLGVSALPGVLEAGGPVGGDIRLRLAGYRIVDANGDDIDGASLTSDLLNPVPEPAGLALAAVGLATALRRRARRRTN
ncbi:hypothetical protein TBR22_A43080 [Luteitalea sp. TBR-22]|uniref:hypothetical protein n=1 Tax=Luteitalea sp. TBR-22 TaxID=2802971 RepID=UPI001AFC2F60|nr:hypothetical protein [Luteitalea sp. TBR-22]BCS35082.1 hypothetical protein TBR22_A43080 [Luteitalea sp. TBR-22]